MPCRRRGRGSSLRPAAAAGEAERAHAGPPPTQGRERGLAQARRRRHGSTRASAWIRRGREGGGATDPAELDAAELEAGGARGGGRSLGVPAREEKGVAWGGRRKGPCGEEVVGREWERGGAGGGAVGV